MKMRRRIRSYKRPSKVRELLTKHIESNINTYIFLSILFLIGIALGIFFINSLSSSQTEELKSYIIDQVININTNEVNYFKELAIENILIIVVMWLAGLTIVGIIIDYAILIYKGFSIGYTISALTLSIGTGKAFGFIFSGMFMQNLLLIPALIGTAVSGMRFFKEILKNRDKESLAIGVIKHTLFSLLMIGITLFSAFLEAFASDRLLKLVLNYII